MGVLGPRVRPARGSLWPTPAQELLWFGLVCALSPCKIASWGFVRVFVFACFLIIEVIGACYNQNTHCKKKIPVIVPWVCAKMSAPLSPAV